jgi:hypothetical protein
VVNAAADTPAFYAARIPEPCMPAALLVLSADCKGVAMGPEYWRFHLAREHQRLYPGIKQGHYAVSIHAGDSA